MSFWEAVTEIASAFLCSITIILCTPVGWVGLLILWIIIDSWR